MTTHSSDEAKLILSFKQLDARLPDMMSRLISKMLLLMQEYIASHDRAEAKLCLRQLNCRSMHHELVKQALRVALEEKTHSPALQHLLSQLVTEGHITDDQLLKASRLRTIYSPERYNE